MATIHQSPQLADVHEDRCAETQTCQCLLPHQPSPSQALQESQLATTGRGSYLGASRGTVLRLSIQGGIEPATSADRLLQLLERRQAVGRKVLIPEDAAFLQSANQFLMSDEEADPEDHYTWLVYSPTWRSKRLEKILQLCDTELQNRPSKNKRRTKRVRGSTPSERPAPAAPSAEDGGGGRYERKEEKTQRWRGLKTGSESGSPSREEESSATDNDNGYRSESDADVPDLSTLRGAVRINLTDNSMAAGPGDGGCLRINTKSVREFIKRQEALARENVTNQGLAMMRRQQSVSTQEAPPAPDLPTVLPHTDRPQTEYKLIPSLAGTRVLKSRIEHIVPWASTSSAVHPPPT
ncbi:Hypp6585 [Branchiostoma lanceolatum]|uniref:Hypp6585 protein n=1 Tax=Branchiostoma lanceolatum TaxID=7740 RepID=A0A8J9YVA0_BRALA|nr:Hypp6585 [Branchiostoma lanceolatum]